MTKPKDEETSGIGSFWKIRVYMHGAILHLPSRDEPVIHMRDGRVSRVDITNTEHGDTIGFLDWSEAKGVTLAESMTPQR